MISSKKLASFYSVLREYYDMLHTISSPLYPMVGIKYLNPNFEVVILVVVVVVLVVQCGIINGTVATSTIDPAAAADIQTVLSKDQIASYARDGYLYTKGLLSRDVIDDLSMAVHEAVLANPQHPGGYFSLLQSGGIFLNQNKNENYPSSPSSNSPTTRANNNIYREVAIQSIIPNAVAELMQLNMERGDNLRLLRYVILYLYRIYMHNIRIGYPHHIFRIIYIY
jgi:hypothetical protein